MRGVTQDSVTTTAARSEPEVAFTAGVAGAAVVQPITLAGVVALQALPAPMKRHPKPAASSGLVGSDATSVPQADATSAARTFDILSVTRTAVPPVAGPVVGSTATAVGLRTKVKGSGAADIGTPPCSRLTLTRTTKAADSLVRGTAA
jgi:hypothetical protein